MRFQNYFEYTVYLYTTLTPHSHELYHDASNALISALKNTNSTVQITSKLDSNSHSSNVVLNEYLIFLSKPTPTPTPTPTTTPARTSK